MRGPMTRNEILQARQWRAQLEGIELPPNSIAKTDGRHRTPKEHSRTKGIRIRRR